MGWPGLLGAVVATAMSLGAVAAGAGLPVVTARLSAHRSGHGQPERRSPVAAAPAGAGPRCPLTGEPAPGGTVPRRPALAVKIDNYPDARPQSALDQADIVFEEPVEGGITRLVAVYQCQSPPLIGPVRSAREPDVAIADELSDPLFVHAGGIDPILAMIDAADLTDIDLVTSDSSLAITPPGRDAPYDTYVSPATMWATEPDDTTPPAPLFAYTSSPPQGGEPVRAVDIPFSGYSDDTWTWVGSAFDWQLSIGGEPATTPSGDSVEGPASPVAAADVVVLSVHTFTGPWVENSEGAQEVEVDATGSGPALVLRDGQAVSGTWERPSLSAPAQLVDGDDRPIDLTPGETWVELVPDSVPVSVTGASPTGTSGRSGASGSASS